MRKTTGILSLLLLAAAGSLVSCSDENPFISADGKGGRISLNLSPDGKVVCGVTSRAGQPDDATSSILPDPEDFSVSLQKNDGSYQKTWSTTDKFNKENSFPGGDYTLDVHYVKPGATDDDEGFEHPVFHGTESTVHVSPGDVSYVTVTAQLANAMVSVRYTDAFKQNFANYSTSIQTEGHPLVMFARNETRPAYVTPSDNVKLNVSLTNNQGNIVTVNPASFNVRARHHYIVTIDVTGESTQGNLALNVTFSEDVVTESVVVSLGEELWTTPEPEIKSKGFEDKKQIEIFEGDNPDAEFDVFALGGLKTTTLNFLNSTYTPAFGRSVQLVKANAQTQALLLSEGVEALGFFPNVDRLGVIKVGGFLSGLPAGTHSMQVTATDVSARTSEPLTLNVRVKAINIELAYSSQPKFKADEVEVELFTNSPSVRDKVRFMAPDANNRMVDARILSVKDGALSTPSGTGLTYSYTYKLQVSPLAGNTIDIRAVYGKRTADLTIDVDIPRYSIEADAYANRVLLRILPEEAEDLEEIINEIKFYNNESLVQSTYIERDLTGGMIIISGLTPGFAYSALTGMLGIVPTAVAPFTTELDSDVTNGGFETTESKISYSGVQVGGAYRVSPVDYHLKSSIEYNSLQGWADLNTLTCWSGSNPRNTWFMVPSTFAEDGKAVLRSVGYNHKGTVPAKSGGAFNTTYYCENSPKQADLEKSAGELFLGSYNFNGTATRTDGKTFASRPATLSFEYTYSPVEGGETEEGEAYIRIYSADGTQIAGETIALPEAKYTTKRTIALSYPFGVKAARMELGFRSVGSGVTPVVHIPTGGELNEGQTLGNHTLTANSYHALAVGSVLTLDNVTLGYDFPSVNPQKNLKGRNTGKLHTYNNKESRKGKK